MSCRVALLSSTFLSTLIAGAALAAESAASTRAVDAVNAHFEVLGGSYAQGGLAAASASLAVPLGQQFGVQFDGTAGTFRNRLLGTGGGHLFWRNPQQGLLGIYGDHIHWSQYGGVNVSHVGGEAEAYLGRVTLHAVAGVEFGNNASAIFGSSSSSRLPGNDGNLLTSSQSSDLRNVTRFFDRVTLSYYLTDNWKASIGHRLYSGQNMLALGTEYAVPAGNGVMAALFGEGRWGEGNGNYGAWGGARFYIGTSDKSLIRRHREDDPAGDLGADTLFSIANSLGPNSSSSSAVCDQAGEFFNGAVCVVPSDARLKTDVILLARLDNGIGLYRFRYLSSDIVHVGVMAQEVAAIVPDAVMLASDGYHRVDYALLGLRPMTWDEWMARQAVPAARAA